MTTLDPTQAQQLKNNGITLSKPQSVTINGKAIAYFSQSQGNLENLVLLIDLGKGQIPVISAYARRGEMQGFEKQLLAIAGTFEYTPQPCTKDGVPLAPTRASSN